MLMLKCLFSDEIVLHFEDNAQKPTSSKFHSTDNPNVVSKNYPIVLQYTQSLKSHTKK